MLKKGIIFSLDMLVATGAALIILLSIFFFLSQSNISLNDQDIFFIGLDSLTVLEMDSTFETSVTTGSAKDIQEYLNALPQQICGRIVVYDRAKVSISNTAKTNCLYGNTTTVVRRSFIVDTVPHYAEMEVWYE